MSFVGSELVYFKSFELNWPQVYRESSVYVEWIRDTVIRDSVLYASHPIPSHMYVIRRNKIVLLSWVCAQARVILVECKFSLSLSRNSYKASTHVIMAHYNYGIP